MSTYKGNNIGLTFDGTGWSYTNLAQDFIDTSAFSTEEPEFPTATQPTTPDEEIPDCPAGYVYDETLKQCVPDPSVQNSYMQEQQNNTTESEKQQAVQIPGTNRFTSDNNFIATDAEYENMSPKELIENYKARGYITKDEQGNLIVDLNRVDLGATAMDNILGRFGSGGGEGQARKKKLFKFLMDKNLVNSKLNPDVFNFYPTGGQAVTSDTFPVTRLTGDMGKIVLPKYLSSTVDTSFTGPTMADVAGGTLKVEDVGTKVSNFSNAALNKVITDVKAVQETAESSTLEQAQIAKAVADADKARAQADEARLKVDNFQPGEDTQREQDRKETFIQNSNKSRDEARKDYVKQQAKNIVKSGTERPTGTGGLMSTSFDRDRERTPSGKSYTQSKIEQAAKTGRYSGF